MNIRFSIHQRLFLLLILLLYLPTVGITYFVFKSINVNIDKKLNLELEDKKKVILNYFQRDYENKLKILREISASKELIFIYNAMVYYNEPELAKEKLKSFGSSLNFDEIQIYNNDKKLIIANKKEIIPIPASFLGEKPRYSFLEYGKNLYLILSSPLIIFQGEIKSSFGNIVLIKKIDKKFVKELSEVFNLPVIIETSNISVGNFKENFKNNSIKVKVIVGKTILSTPVYLIGLYDISFYKKFKKENSFIFLFILIGMFFFCIIFSYIISNVLTSPIAKLGNMVAKLSTGKLSIEDISYRFKDEIFSIKENLIKFLKNLGSNFKILFEQNRAVFEIKDSFRSIITKLHRNASTLKENNDKSIQELEILNQKLTEIIESFDRNLARYETNKDVLDELKDLVEEGYEISKISNITFKEINRNSQEIKNILNFITDISSQINLLSVNASIESNKSGEAGSGFSVIADEIKTLAKTIDEFVENIKKLIENNYNIVKQGVDYSNQLDNILEKINNKEKEVFAIIKDFYEFIKAKKEGLAELIENIKTINSNLNIDGNSLNNIYMIINNLEESINRCEEILKKMREIIIKYVE